MASHAMSGDTDAGCIQLGESGEYGLGKLILDICVHVVTVIIWSLGCVNIESSTGTEVVSIILTLDTESTWKSIS